MALDERSGRSGILMRAPSITTRADPDAAHDESTGWHFIHPPRGTCAPGCSFYGRCHCGCGASPKFSQVTFAPSGRMAGRPFTFVSGHQLRVIHPRAGMWSRNGVPIETIRPLVFWLRDRHGSIRAVAGLLHMPEATLRGTCTTDGGSGCLLKLRRGSPIWCLRTESGQVHSTCGRSSPAPVRSVAISIRVVGPNDDVAPTPTISVWTGAASPVCT